MYNTIKTEKGANIPRLRPTYHVSTSIGIGTLLSPEKQFILRQKGTKSYKFGPQTIPSMEQVLSILVQWCHSCKTHPGFSEEGLKIKAYFQKEISKKNNDNKNPPVVCTKRSLFCIPSIWVVPMSGRESLPSFLVENLVQLRMVNVSHSGYSLWTERSVTTVWRWVALWPLG